MKLHHLVSMSMATVLTLAFNAVNAQSPPPAPVEAAKVIEKRVAPRVWVPGTVISRQDSRIASEVSGVLERVAEVGDLVKRGATLARVNHRQLQLQSERDEADLKRLRSRFTFAEKQLARTQRLSSTNNTAEFRIDELQMERDVIEQEIALAEVKLAETQYLIERSTIQAPFDGVVAARFHHPGEHIAIGEELLRLVNPSNLEITANATVEIRRFIKPGQPVSIRAAERELSHPIRSVVPIGDAQSRMIEVRVTISGDWAVGDAVSVALAQGPEKSELLVPRDALVLRNNEVFVYRVREGIAEKLSVLPGVGDERNVAVKGDLVSGDFVVTRGAERLEDGRPVQILEGIAKR